MLKGVPLFPLAARGFCLTFTALLLQAQTDAPSSPLFAQIGQMTQELSRLSGFPVRKPVAHHVMTRAQLREFLEAKAKETLTSEAVRAQEAALKKLGLVPADFQLLPATIDLLTEQAAAFYDERTHALYMLEGGSDALQQIALVHEIAHALADQSFPLGRFLHSKQLSDDAVLARQAVAEGQATWLMTEYMLKRIGQSLQDAPEMLAGVMDMQAAMSGQYPALASVPLYLRESLLFPYAKGVLFQQAVLAKSGKQGFAQVFREPPVSSQQILHPETYFSKQTPTLPALPVVPEKGTLRLLASGTLGEFDLDVLLRQYAKEDGTSVAERWRGGQYAVHETKDQSRQVLSYAVEWQTAADAIRFLQQYERVLAGKWKNLQMTEKTEAVLRGQGDDGYFRIERKGAVVSGVEGAAQPVQLAETPPRGHASGEVH